MSAGWRIRHTDVHCHLFPGEICHELGEGFGITRHLDFTDNPSQLTTGGQLISTDCNSLKEKNRLILNRNSIVSWEDTRKFIA